MLINLAGQLRLWLFDSLTFCGLPQDVSEAAAIRLADLIGTEHEYRDPAGVLTTLSWLDGLKHRADVFEAVHIAVLLRLISRLKATEEVAQDNATALAIINELPLATEYIQVIRGLVALPEPERFWQPSTADETLVLDVERVWFAASASTYRQHTAALHQLNAVRGLKPWLIQWQKNLSQIVDSGLIYFLPETRSVLEGRAFLNLSFEIADIKANQLDKS